MPSNFEGVEKSKNEFIIPFIGLKIGTHEFDFSVSDEFFEGIEYSVVERGRVDFHIVFEKKETMMIADFELNGTVETQCDRCGDELSMPINGSYQLIFKFGDDESEDETLVVLPSEAYRIDLRPHFHEFITVSLPSRMIHEEGDCNEEMEDLIDEYSAHSEEDEELDPRWSELNKLKNK